MASGSTATSHHEPNISDRDQDGKISQQPGPQSMAEQGLKVDDMGLQHGQQPVPPVPCLQDELQALKMRILELEEQTKTTKEAFTDQSPRPQLSKEKEEFLRMEQCLYRHRKMWETSHQIDGDFSLRLEPRFGKWTPKVSGPWSYHWSTAYMPQYARQEPFDPSHRCQDISGAPNQDTMDDFDHTIDFGQRRDRVRKTFEWEMDRLYLAEEVDKRRRQRLEEAELRAQQERGPTPEEALHDLNDEGNHSDVANTDGDMNQEAEHVELPEPQTNKFDWVTFKQLSRVGENHVCFIDILTEEPTIDSDLAAFRGLFGYSGVRTRKVERPQAINTTSTVTGQAPLPERIRITSEVLGKILSTILEDENYLLGEHPHTPWVFIRPFKVLIYSEQALRDWCKALDERFGPETAKNTDTGIEGDTTDAQDGSQISTGEGNDKTSTVEKVVQKRQDETEDDENEDEDDADGTKSKHALMHLKCLLGFLDSHVTDKRTYLNSSSCNKVFFSDLWHLYRPGLEVIGSDGKQAYRIIHVASPAHRVVPAWQRYDTTSKDKSSNAAFSIACVYIDFDGTRIGPVLRTFDFKSFEGEREVASFEVYPLRFHPPLKKSDFGESEWKDIEPIPASDRLRHRLIHRGAKFLEVAAVRHMYYAGPTLGARDEVESQVVIDFETAFSVEDESTQSLVRPVLESVVRNPARDDASDDEDNLGCQAACCRSEVVYHDTSIDDKQSSEYIEHLLAKTGPHDSPSPAIIPQLFKELQLQSAERSAISDDELVIMSYRVFGFVLRNRKWAQLDLTFLTDVQPSQTPTTTADEGEFRDGKKLATGGDKQTKRPSTAAFDRLVLEKGHRPMIESLITQHFRDKKATGERAEQVDIVKGKGRGLILLLHGAPGVGKTSTAGDLGTSAKEVERTLEMNFALANRWGCILLLDEADVFLGERTKEDLQRNALVAVFLRVMEYYAGILFLTTNRVGDFDEAFTSRIHISLYYPELNEEKTAKVFLINIDLIEERFAHRNRRIDIDKYGIGSFATKHFNEYPHARWNGRQIRNACQTALALAEFEAQGNSHEAIVNPDAVVKLEVEHFNTVRNAYVEFTKYMDDLYGTSAGRRAKEAKLRAIWVDENDRVVGVGGDGLDRRTAFAIASRGHAYQQSQQGFQHPQSYSQPQGFSYQQRFPQQQQSFPNANAPFSSYANPSQMSMQGQQFTSSQVGNSGGVTVSGTPHQASQPFVEHGQGTEGAQPQPLPTVTPSFHHSIQGMYEGFGHQGNSQPPPGNFGAPGGGSMGR
ncbi:hypothetical protein N0V84_004804 [Fusarium piperis]|uniref:AAA+ ATPase domain-containing protein n=1 Tax=Fusarium piperis TaxID=1435070 RepID=A0A9W8WEU8_9HYPO|nr:hypothetical protein N0V84_004804 [Fusarium piperis]